MPMSNYRTDRNATTYDRIVKTATTGNYNQKADYNRGEFYWGSDFLGQVIGHSVGQVTLRLRGGATITDTPEAAINAMVASYKATR